MSPRRFGVLLVAQRCRHCGWIRRMAAALAVAVFAAACTSGHARKATSASVPKPTVPMARVVAPTGALGAGVTVNVNLTTAPKTATPGARLVSQVFQVERATVRNRAGR
jgi:hypothetical protein